jgi:hypothetical protein
MGKVESLYAAMEGGLLLVQEEMRWVLIYHKWKAAWWHMWSNLQTHNDATILSGVSGYAYKQAAICQHMATKCARYWLPQLKSKGITPSWATEYADLSNPPHVAFSQVGALDPEGATPDELDLDEVDIDGDEDQDEEDFEVEGDEYDLDSYTLE